MSASHRPGEPAGIASYPPMLATPWPEPFVDPDWVFELKWDGVRAVVSAGPGVDLRIVSRAGNVMTDRYPELGGLRPDRPLVLDGEIVAFDASGRPSFEVLQQRMARSGAAATSVVPATYAVFDVLVDGDELIDAPWEVRRERLEGLDLPPGYDVSSVVAGDPTGLWAFVEERGIEGMVAKRRDSVYRPGVRSPDWRKITRFRQVRAVVGGYLPGDRGRSASFGSLLLGLWHGGALRWIGAVGSGFNDRQLAAIRAALDEMAIGECPFGDPSGIPSGAVWVAPHLVALVQFKEFTAAGRLRGPSFKGFTDDDPGAVTWEREGPDAV